MSARNAFQGCTPLSKREPLNAAGVLPLAPAASSLAEDEWVRLLAEADRLGRADWSDRVQTNARRRARIQLRIEQTIILAGAIALALLGGL